MSEIPVQRPPDIEQIEREAYERGREEASQFFALCDDEGYQRGYSAALNWVWRHLRERARTDPNARAILRDLLGG